MKGVPRKKRIMKADGKDDKRRQVLAQELLHKVEVGAKDEVDQKDESGDPGVGQCSTDG